MDKREFLKSAGKMVAASVPAARFSGRKKSRRADATIHAAADREPQNSRHPLVRKHEARIN